MADIENIVSEVVTGLVDNCRVNGVAMNEGPDADLAIDLYYLDGEIGDNDELKERYGIPTDEEYAAIKQRVGKFLAANHDWRFGADTQLIDA